MIQPNKSWLSLTQKGIFFHLFSDLRLKFKSKQIH